MLAWLTENLSTVIITALIIAAAIFVVIKKRRDRKNGGCSCGCSGCPMSGECKGRES